MNQNDQKAKVRERYQQQSTLERVLIPARPRTGPFESTTTQRVCAYCRVSTDSVEQLSSFELQRAYYEELTERNPNWELRMIYADEGISGTSLKNRDQFNLMITDCESGKYDLIVTKSVSRFARNIVDCISLVRRLKNLPRPVGVYFEIDNLYTLSETSELMLSLLATFAQEESVKKSDSMLWSLKQRFKDGKLLTPSLLGYDQNGDRYLEINQDEAKTVSFIFDAFLAGCTAQQLAAILTDIGRPTKTGNTDWSESSIFYILRNERYCGNILTWKTFTADIFEHRKRRNHQDREQYLWKDTHEAIISVEKFETVQTLIENRRHHLHGGYPIMQVIDDGVFSGFVPVNHHWINTDVNAYFNASNSVFSKDSPRRVRKNVFSFFDLEDYQVVRAPFLSTLPMGPSILISEKRIRFNRDCIRRFDSVEFVQLLLHPTKRKIAIRTCEASDSHSIVWKRFPYSKMVSKSLLCTYFSIALFEIMGWNPEYVYRTRGCWHHRGGEQMIVFDLEQSEIIITCNTTQPPTATEQITKGRKRLVTFPEDWGTSFGLPFYEHQMRNQCLDLGSSSGWNSNVKCIPVPSDVKFDLLTPIELEETIAQLRNS
ncbi:MAG: recombinase family protein [Petrimonas sp.]|nr:recombinase family protein [Petrimonas sp.]